MPEHVLAYSCNRDYPQGLQLSAVAHRCLGAVAEADQVLAGGLGHVDEFGAAPNV